MTAHVTIAGKTYKVVLTPGEPPQVDGVPFAVDLRELQPGVLSLLHTGADGRTMSYRCIADEDALVIDGERIPYAITDPRSLRATAAGSVAGGPKPLKSPMPGRIVRVLVAVGDHVEQGQGCVVIEAMKMQNELKAPRAGTVAKLSATVGETVPANAVLLVVE